MEERGGEDARGFLPPEPGGPEPDLGAPPAPPAGHRGFLPPEEAAPQAYGAPSGSPPGRAGSPSTAAPGAHHQVAEWAPAPAVPDNGDALAGLILSISAAALLLLSVGLSSIISVVCAALGIYYSRKGRARVERGETPKHHGVAKAGFVTGIVTLVLSILLTIAWAAFAILYATNEDFRQDLEDELDEDGASPDGFETAIPLGLAALRVIGLLLR